jgi:hypothetical protein
MRASIASTIWRFSTTRMLHEYTERMYLPAAGVELPVEETTERPGGEAERIVAEAG